MTAQSHETAGTEPAAAPVTGTFPQHDPLRTADFEQRVEKALQEWHVPGIAIAVLDGQHTWHRGFGFSKLPDRPVTPTTNFFAASTTKAFLAAVISKLVSDDKNHPDIQWNTPVSQLIRDDFVLEDEWTTNRVTIEDTLSHRTGMPHHDRCHGRKPDKTTPYEKPRPAVREVVRQMRYLPLTADLRTTYQYCNLMYVAASHVVETRTGVWLGKWIKDEIFTPLGMTGTYFATEDAVDAKEDLAQGYRYNEAESRFEEVPWMDMDSSTGAGSNISNAVDYAKWARAVMERSDKLTGVDWEALTTPRTLIPTTGTTSPFTGPQAYALGWRTGVYKGHWFLEHTGGLNCFGTQVIIFPSIQYAFVGFGNTAASSNFVEQSLAFHLIDEKLRVPHRERYDWDAEHQDILRKGREKARTVKQRFYPQLPAKPLDLKLPIEAYAGSYYNAGYQILEVYMDKENGILRADRTEVTWPEHMAFEHVSGEYFVIKSDWDGDFSAYFPETYAAEFQIGADGAVKSLGITWEEKMASKKIWLQRVDED